MTGPVSPDVIIRLANEGDADLLCAIAAAAYQPYAAMIENLAYYPRRGYIETHRADQDGFHRVFFRKPVR